MFGGRLPFFAGHRVATGVLGVVALGLGLGIPASTAAATTATQPVEHGFETVWDDGHLEVVRYTTNMYGAEAFNSGEHRRRGRHA